MLNLRSENSLIYRFFLQSLKAIFALFLLAVLVPGIPRNIFWILINIVLIISSLMFAISGVDCLLVKRIKILAYISFAFMFITAGWLIVFNLQW